jgi:hypothetical protein
VGHVNDPLDFVPFRLCSWTHRFDNPRPHPPSIPIYRTLYCAEHRETCYGEVFNRYARSVKTARERSKISGRPLEEHLHSEIGIGLLLEQAIARARIRILEGDLVDLDDSAVRRDLEIRHWDLLQEHKLDFLDISTARSRRRKVTQRIGHALFKEGAAGVIYGSNVDNRRCMALFESRAFLEPLGEPEPLAGLLHEIEPILKKRDIVIKAG